jgi:hypothetical protein
MIDPLTRLTAIEEIKQLKARYFRLMDTRDWEGMSLTFCSDAVWDCSQGFQYTPLDGDPIGPVGPITKGRHAIIAWLKEALHGKATVHHGHCHEITIDGEGSGSQNAVARSGRSLPRSLSRRRRRMAHLADEANAAI